MATVILFAWLMTLGICQRTGIHSVETSIVNQAGDALFSVLIVTWHRNRDPVFGTFRFATMFEAVRQQIVERFDNQPTQGFGNP